MSLASFVPDPLAVVQDFDAWHLAMEGPEAHEQMRQRRMNALLDRQIEAASAEACGDRTVLDAVVARSIGYRRSADRPDLIEPATGDFKVSDLSHVVSFNAAGDVVGIEAL